MNMLSLLLAFSSFSSAQAATPVPTLLETKESFARELTPTALPLGREWKCVSYGSQLTGGARCSKAGRRVFDSRIVNQNWRKTPGGYFNADPFSYFQAHYAAKKGVTGLVGYSTKLVFESLALTAYRSCEAQQEIFPRPIVGCTEKGPACTSEGCAPVTEFTYLNVPALEELKALTVVRADGHGGIVGEVSETPEAYCDDEGPGETALAVPGRIASGYFACHPDF